MAAPALLLNLALACKGGEDTGDTATYYPDLADTTNAVQTFVDQHHTDIPWLITGDQATGLVEGTGATTNTGSMSNWLTYTIDGNNIYGGVAGNDSPTHVNSGVEDRTYNYTPAPGTTSVYLESVTQLGNLESHKEDTTSEPFNVGGKWGSMYAMISSVDSDQGSCTYFSGVRQNSADAESYAPRAC